MRERVNSYIAILFITIAGAGATMLIIHVAYANAFDVTLGGSQAAYSSLQESILKQ